MLTFLHPKDRNYDLTIKCLLWTVPGVLSGAKSVIAEYRKDQAKINRYTTHNPLPNYTRLPQTLCLTDSTGGLISGLTYVPGLLFIGHRESDLSSLWGSLGCCFTLQWVEVFSSAPMHGCVNDKGIWADNKKELEGLQSKEFCIFWW